MTSSAVIDPNTGLPIGPEVDVTPARRRGTEILEGQFVRLEPLDIDRHGAGLHAISHGADANTLWLYMPTGPFADLEAHRTHLATLRDNPDFEAYILLEPETGAVLGQACYMRIDPSNRAIEVGYILYGPKAQRSAATTEAMYLMARHVFEDLGYRRYEWKCNDLNAPSKRAALRLGFSYEGLFRQAVIVKGRNRDTAWYSMLDSEWPARKVMFETWLDASNFDASGHQKRSLSECAPG